MGSLMDNQDDWAILGLKLIGPDELEGRDPGISPENLNAGYAVCPKSTEDVAAVVSWCAERDISIVPQGGRTGLAGGCISSPGQLILMMDRVNSIREIDTASDCVVVDAGATLSQVEDRVGEYGLTVGIDLAARGSCTIGGMVATNAGGNEAFRNGVMRHRVLGLEVVLPDGSVMSDLKNVVKANEGYDIKQLFIGSEGTLGVVTGVVLKLQAAPKANRTILISARDALSARALLQRLRRTFGLNLLAAEIMWRDYFHTVCNALNLEPRLGGLEGNVYVLFELEDGTEEDVLLDLLGQSLEALEISGALIAKNEQERAEMWAVREESFEIDRSHPSCCSFDVSVPMDKLDTYFQTIRTKLLTLDPELGIYVFGHFADGNLHCLIGNSAPVGHLYTRISDALYDGLSEIGGSFSAEHGIGTDKRAALRQYVDPAKLEMMVAIKKAVDPKNIMNPHKIL